MMSSSSAFYRQRFPIDSTLYGVVYIHMDSVLLRVYDDAKRAARKNKAPPTNT